MLSSLESPHSSGDVYTGSSNLERGKGILENPRNPRPREPVLRTRWVFYSDLETRYMRLMILAQ